MLKFIIVFYIVTPLIVLEAQTKPEKNDEHLNKPVYGVVIKDNIHYLITNEGYLSVSQSNDDAWLDYYKKVYGDSVENPNIIIVQEETNYLPFRLISPVIPTEDWADEKWGFSKNMYLYDFIMIDENGKYKIRTGILGIINSIAKTPQVILPESR